MSKFRGRERVPSGEGMMREIQAHKLCRSLAEMIAIGSQS